MTESAVFHVKHNGKVIILDNFCLTDAVYDIKKELEKITSILPENQKLIGLRSTTSEVLNVLIIVYV